MRRQDEIRLVFPGQDPETQKLLLSELDAYALAFDSEEVFELLRGALGNPVARVRHQAAVTLGWFLPRYVARKMGAVSAEAGVWSANRGGEASKPLKLENPGPLRQRARERLAPLANALATRYAGLTEERAAARLGLMYLGSDVVADRLAEAARLAPTDADTVWAWAFCGGGERDADQLSRHLDRWGPGHPELLIAAGAMPAAAVTALFERLSGRLDGGGTANMALALGRLPGKASLEPLARLAAKTSGWGRIHVLRALGCTREPDALPLVRKLHDESNNEFLRQNALRAAGGLRGRSSVEFCLAQVRGEPGPCTAQALESLVRLNTPREELAEAARPHVTSPHLRTRVNALLASVESRAASLPRSFMELLEHDEALPRVEAAFCMGYWAHDACVDALAVMARADPVAAVRQQAIKSLSRQPARDAAPHLVRVVLAGEPEDALTAVRVLARGGPRAMPGARELLLAQLGAADAGRRSLILRGVAALDGPGAGALDPELARDVAAPDPAVATAALDAWKLTGGPRSSEHRRLVLGLAGHERAPLRSAAIAASFLAGELVALDLLAQQLTTDGPALITACETLMELALIAGEALTSDHSGLEAALDATSTFTLKPYPPGRDIDLLLKGPESELELDPAPIDPPSKLRNSLKHPSSTAVPIPSGDRPRVAPSAPIAPIARVSHQHTLVPGRLARQLEAEPLAQRLERSVQRALAWARMFPALAALPLVVLFLCGLIVQGLGHAPDGSLSTGKGSPGKSSPTGSGRRGSRAPRAERRSSPATAPLFARAPVAATPPRVGQTFLLHGVVQALFDERVLVSSTACVPVMLEGRATRGLTIGAAVDLDVRIERLEGDLPVVSAR